jgi:MFS family permease
MTYFFVLPVFVLAMLALAVAAILCATVPKLRWALPFAWRVLVWSGVGCVLANLPVFALHAVPFALERSGLTPAQGTTKNLLGVAFAAGLLFGPIVASAAGFFGGALFGGWRASRQSKSRG